MKYLVKLFVIIFLLFLGTNIQAEEKILYIDMKKVLNESKAGKSAQEYLRRAHQLNIEENQDGSD